MFSPFKNALKKKKCWKGIIRLYLFPSKNGLQSFLKLSRLLILRIKICKTLRKHAYSNILKISPPKTENLQIKNSDIFHISAQNIDWGYSLEPPRRGGSNE